MPNPRLSAICGISALAVCFTWLGSNSTYAAAVGIMALSTLCLITMDF